MDVLIAIGAGSILAAIAWLYRLSRRLPVDAGDILAVSFGVGMAIGLVAVPIARLTWLHAFHDPEKPLLIAVSEKNDILVGAGLGALAGGVYAAGAYLRMMRAKENESAHHPPPATPPPDQHPPLPPTS